MSFNTGIMGLRAAQTDLSVIGNNIANASTKGFKQSRAEFGDMYTASMLGNGAMKSGSGVAVERISQQHTQGTTDYTDRALDMAIEGNGYFMMSNNGQLEYTRAGYFDLDKEGYIVNNNGNRLQGYSADAEGAIISGAPGDMQLGQSSLEPKSTTDIKVGFNFDSRKPGLDIEEFNPNNRASYSDANRTSVFDSLGKEHELTQYFIKVPLADADGADETAKNGNTWAVISSFDGRFYNADGTALQNGDDPLTAKNWNLATADELDIEAMVPATLVFNTQGTLTGYNEGFSSEISDEGTPENPAEEIDNPYKFTITLPNDIPLNGAFLGAADTEELRNQVTYDLSGTTQYGATFSAQSQFQNGYTAGNMSGLEVEKDGTIVGRYTNGQLREIGQVPIVTFRNPGGLKPNGSTSWVATMESGDAIANQANTGITGAIIGSALEESNVDLAEELVKMIIGQRNYQANAKTIQTQDTITQTIINLR